MKAQSENRSTALLCVTSALDGDGWLELRHGRFTPENDPVPIVQEAGKSHPYRNSNPEPSNTVQELHGSVSTIGINQFVQWLL